MVNNIKNNIISEISAKKGLTTLNELKDIGIIKEKKRTSKQKELLNLFKDLSDTILTDKTLMSSKDKNEKEKENGNENDETLMSSKDDNDDENENENENEDDDETMSQNEKNEIIKGKNDILDEIIDKSKSFEEQMELLKKLERLKGYWH